MGWEGREERKREGEDSVEDIVELSLSLKMSSQKGFANLLNLSIGQWTRKIIPSHHCSLDPLKFCIGTWAQPHGITLLAFQNLRDSYYDCLSERHTVTAGLCVSSLC